MTLIVYFDGLCEPVNPGGIAAYGFVIYRGGQRLHAGRGVVGAGYLGDDVTNNVAEYTALIRALEWLVENGYAGEDLVVRGDSQLVIRQLRGEYAVRSPRIAPLHARVKLLLGGFPSVKLEWVPRELNAEADSLSRMAYEEFLREHPEALSFYRGARGKGYQRAAGGLRRGGQEGGPRLGGERLGAGAVQGQGRPPGASGGRQREPAGRGAR